MLLFDTSLIHFLSIEELEFLSSKKDALNNMLEGSHQKSLEILKREGTQASNYYRERIQVPVRIALKADEALNFLKMDKSYKK